MVEVGVRVGRVDSSGGDGSPSLSSSARRESVDDEDDSECRSESVDAIKDWVLRSEGDKAVSN